jgi:amino acid adenylation domain-containing protein
MSDLMRPISDTLARQRAIRARCVHPTGTFVPFPKEAIEQSIPERFEQQVRRNPDRIAVKSRSQHLTYEELNRAANRVAHAILEHRGEGQEPVPLLLHRETPFLVAILGVLKAGKIQVPLAPSLPRDRLAWILEDLPASLIVTNNENFALARELAGERCRVINVDALDSRLSTENPGLSISPDAYAQIFYTSGSTGRPKGVVQNHRNLLYQIMEMTNASHTCAEDRKASLASGQWTYGALLTGAAVYPFDVKKEGVAAVADWILQEGITTIAVVASTFRGFVSTLTGKERFPSLRLLALGSEPVYKSDVELYKKHFADDCVLAHAIGATETGIYRQYLIDKETEITDSILPVGYAVQGTEVLLLDDDGQPVGPDQIGEIAVKSRHFPIGYWRQPERTAAVFLPALDDPGVRIYRTGDLGRMLPDGCLFHLGRKDFQVKIRGYRVETAEVEQALLDLDAVKEAAVVGREDFPGDQRLVAYFVPSAARVLTVTELRRVLAAKLPDYMVPSAFVVLDALPLTGSGKVDRRALPAPGRARPDLETTFVEPRTPVEEVLAKIWGNLLALDTVGIHDGFFELGGHSLLATQLLSRTREAFQVEVPLRAFFEAPTVAGLAETLVRHEPAPGRMAAIARLRQKIEAMSAEEIAGMLEAEKKARGIAAEAKP